MIASIMYAAIGFLVASLGALFVIPLVHNRAVRLTSKRLETALPQSIAEIHAGRDQLRAEFAVSTRRLELKIDQLKNKAARYFAELSTKSGVIEQIEIERDAQQAENAALKAQIDALAVRSKEVIDQLKDNAGSYLAELGNKGIVIDKLNIERNALQAENAALKAQVAALTAGNGARAEDGVDAEVSRNRPNAELPMVPAESVYGLTPAAHDHDDLAVSFVPNMWPVADLFQVPKDSPPANDQGRRDDTVSSVAGESPSAETASIADVPKDALQPSPPSDRRGEGIASRSPRQELAAETMNVPTDGAHGLSRNDRQHRSDAVSDLLMRLNADELRSGGFRREPGARRGSHDERIAVASGRFDVSGGSKTVAPSIRVSPRDGFAGNGPLTRRPRLARFAAAVPIVAGASIAWHYHGQEAMETIKAGIVSLGELSSASTTKSSPDLEVPAGRPRAAGAGRISAQDAAPQPPPRTAPAPAAATSPELVQGELQAVVRDLAALRHGVEQVTAKQEQMAKDIATRQVAEPLVKHTISVPRQPSREQLAPAPETRPITIAGWTLLEVTDGAVVLKGPNGIWTARRGDLVPGVGTVDSVVRWGNRWLVATSRGLISTP